QNIAMTVGYWGLAVLMVLAVGRRSRSSCRAGCGGSAWPPSMRSIRPRTRCEWPWWWAPGSGTQSTTPDRCWWRRWWGSGWRICRRCCRTRIRTPSTRAAPSAGRVELLGDARQRAGAELRHSRHRLAVVPDQADGLLEGPAQRAVPLDLVGADPLTEDGARRRPEQVDADDQVQGAVGRAESAGVDHPGQALTVHQQVRGDQ